MHQSLFITTLDYENIEIKVTNPKKFNLEYVRDEMETITSIIGPHQVYYQNGSELTNIDYSQLPLLFPLEMIEVNTLPVARFLVKFRSRTYPVYVNNFEKKYLLCLKLAIEKKMQSLGLECPFDAQNLKISGQEIPISCQLSEIPYNSEIDMDLNSFISHRPIVTTYDLNEYEGITRKAVMVLIAKGKHYEIKVDERAAKWRRINEGFVIECYCRNRECEARNRTVIVNLGFGLFSMESIRVRSKCPLCFEVSNEFTLAGFFKAAWRFKGTIENTDLQGEEKAWNNFHIWREMFGDWMKLKIAVWPASSN